MIRPSRFARGLTVIAVLGTTLTTGRAVSGTIVEWGQSNNVIGLNTGYSKIAAGRMHLIALTDAGVQTGWGNSTQGELSINSNPFGGTLTEIAAGDEKSAGLWSTGHVTWSGQGFS